MRRINVSILGVLTCVLLLSACSNVYEDGKYLSHKDTSMEDAYSIDAGLKETTIEDKNGSLKENKSSNSSKNLFNSDKFNGRIEDIFYAGDNRLFVYADSFNLYDMVTENIVGEFSISEGRVEECEFFITSKGYAMVGVLYGDSSDYSAGGRSVKCWLFDKNFTYLQTIDLVDLILKEEDFMVFAATVSQDGKKIGIVGNNALYLYDIEKAEQHKVFEYDKTDYADIVMVNSVGFIDHDEKLAFTGMTANLDNSDNIPIYGHVCVDGSQLVCNTVSEYELTDEMIIQSDQIWFPESFDKATGKMLVTDMDGQIMRIVEFEGEDTGGDGVFSSDHGKYVATIEWVSDQGCWRVRIYDALNGKIIHEQMIAPDEQDYSTIICKVRILDEWNECIVVVGKKQETQTFSFFF